MNKKVEMKEIIEIRNLVFKLHPSLEDLREGIVLEHGGKYVLGANLRLSNKYVLSIQPKVNDKWAFKSCEELTIIDREEIMNKLGIAVHPKHFSIINIYKVPKNAKIKYVVTEKKKTYSMY